MTNIVNDVSKGTWFMAVTNKGTVCFCHPEADRTIADAIDPIKDMLGPNNPQIYSVKLSNTNEVVNYFKKLESQSSYYSSAYH